MDSTDPISADKAFAAIEVELGWLIDGHGCYKSDKLRAALDAYIDARIAEKMSDNPCGHDWCWNDMTKCNFCSKCGASEHDDNDK